MKIYSLVVILLFFKMCFDFSWFIQGGVWVVVNLLFPSCVVYGDVCGILMKYSYY